MGTWGTGPFDNDDAADMVAELMEHVRRVADTGRPLKRGRKRTTSDDYYLARAAAQFVLAAHGTDILGGPGLGPVVRVLARIRMDREWLAHWNSPRKIATALDNELLAVICRMHACKGCHKSIKRPEWQELETLVAEARSSPVPKSERTKRLPPRTTRAAVRKLLRAKAPASKR